MTRNPGSSAAQELAEAVAVIVQGNLNDRASFDAALDGAYGVYSFPDPSSGPDVEIRQGKAAAGAARVVRVEHFVQGSVGGAERQSGIPHFESKWQIEEYIRDLGLPATFLQPAYFMENFSWKRADILDGTYESLGLKPDKTLQMIAADDIGAFAALDFENPSEYIGQGLEIAGDELTEPEVVAIMSQVIGGKVSVTPAGPPPNQDWALMIRWLSEKGYQADIITLRAIRPELVTLETWLRENGWIGAT